MTIPGIPLSFLLHFETIYLAYAALTILAMIPIYFGSFRALKEIKKGESEKMSQSDAYLFPVVGSCVLFGFYLLFKFFSKDYINYLLTGYFAIFGASSLATMLGATFHGIMPEGVVMKYARVITLLRFEDSKEEGRIEITWPRILATLLAVLFTVYYVLTKNWIASNLFGLAFALSAIQLLHLDSFKTAITLLFGLFLYDIFWVFGTDVMVSVAKSFNVPVKLLFPRNILQPTWWALEKDFTMLGLGDIVIPGVMVSLCLRFDEHLHTLKKDNNNTKHFVKYYFFTCLLAYFLGLVTTMTVMHTFKAAQPALLYLSPACILAPILMALLRGQLTALFAYSTEPSSTDASDNLKQD